MKRWKIGVKFCGHCNPTVDGPSLLRATQEQELPAVFVPWFEEDKDLLLIINGCTTACSTRPIFPGITLEVGGKLLMECKFSAEQISTVIAEKLRESMDESIQ